MPGRARPLRLALLVATLALPALWSCAPTQAPRLQVEAPAADSSDMPLREFGQLQVFVTDQMTDGRHLKLRGLIRNPYPEPVDGVRLAFAILSAASADARVLDRTQKVLDERLAGGAQTALRLDVETMYAGIGGGGFLIQAFAVTRGGQPLPAPPGWTE